MITTVTLNASIDKAYYMEDGIEYGTVMRVAKTNNTAGGKGLNVARVIQLCGSEVKATGLVGGHNGAYLEELLEKDAIDYDFVHIKGETRSCINILDSVYGSTEYLEAGCVVNFEEEQCFLRKFPEIIAKSNVITISGSIPRGLGKDIYQKLVHIVKEQGKKVILDTSGELLSLGIKSKPTMVKPNKEEIEMLYHTQIAGREDVITYAKKIYEEGIPYVVVSLGGEGALLVCKEGIFQGKPPKVNVVNTVGCGDSMVGAFAVSMEKEEKPQEALRYAVAVATANALSSDTGYFDLETANRILQEVKIVKL